ncbi:DUF6711 family protein [Bacillus sp. SCS-151]|uniref:DUF6711 family protein n=1 Tax=Nanhaiella sioensis TaxID=3115293 RepID=UPI00397CF838
MIKINGVELPTPSKYAIGIQDLSQAERNVRGNMIIERIATKRKIELTWNTITQENLSLVFQSVSDVFFTVEYIDPEKGDHNTGTFYSGDRKAGVMDIRNGVVRWKDAKFNLIER